MKLSERLEARLALRAAPTEIVQEPAYVDSPECRALLQEAADLARSVEDAPCVPVIDGGRMIRPFRQYGRFDIPDDGENPATKEARLLGQFVGQRVRLVPEAGQGGGDG